MAYYSVLDVTPTAEDWIPGYLPAANDRVAAHGGRYLARTATHAQLEGEDQPSLFDRGAGRPRLNAASARCAGPAIWFRPQLVATRAPVQF